MTEKPDAQGRSRTVPLLFWAPLSVSILIIAASVGYFLLVYIPRRDANRERLAAESAQRDAETKASVGCANEVARAVSRVIKEDRNLGWPSARTIIGTSNHYNRRLQKCLVEIDRWEPDGGWSFTIFDAFENSDLLTCFIHPSRHGEEPELCLDSDNQHLDPDKADAQHKALMSE